MTLELSDLDTIKDNALKKFEERLSSAGSDREKIERAAFTLASQLEELYSFTVVLAGGEPDLARTADLWSNLVKTCELFADRILQISQQFSLATAACDHILDIRSFAEELRFLHST